MNFTKTITIIAAAGALALPATAGADTLTHPVTGATNLASGGGWLAWSQPAPHGGYQLAVRAPDGTVSVPAVGKFAAPPQPAIGSNQTGIDGRKLEVLYSRGGDIHAYDLKAKTEAKVKGASSPGVTETAPQISFGRLVFVRSSGKTSGIYALAKGKAKRISSARPGQVAFNGSRIAYMTSAGVRLHALSGRVKDSFARATDDSQARYVVLTRYSVTFLTDAGKVWQSTRFGGSSQENLIRGITKGSADLSPTANSIAFSGSFLRWYLDDEGLKRISTPNLFR